MKKIRQNLICFIMMMIIFGCVGVSISTFITQSYEANKKQNSEYLKEVAIQTSFAVKSKFEEALKRVEERALILSLEDTDNGTIDFAKYKELQEVELMDNIEFRYISIDGVVQNLEEPVVVSDRDYYKNILKGKSGISEIIASRIDHENVFVLYAPIIQKGEVVGGVTCVYNQEYFEKEFELTSFSGKGFSHIVNEDGMMILKTNHKDSILEEDNLFKELSRGVDRKVLEEIEDDFNNQESGRIDYSDGLQSRLAYYEPIGFNEWFIFTVTPVDIVNQVILPLNKPLIQLMVNLGIAVIAFIILLIAVMTKENSAIRIVNRNLKLKSERDFLTNLYNRSAFINNVEIILNGKCDARNYHALFMIDLDEFKSVNDLHGHQEGDQLLKKVGELLVEIGRESDIACRIGGDEFMIFMVDLHSLEIIEKIAERICSKILELTLTSGIDNQISGSIGISIVPNHGSDFTELYRKADQASYQAKRNGKNQYCVYKDIVRK